MQKYTAIILASKDIGEFDRLYIMYTLEQGLFKVAARGVRKPAARLAGHLEPGTMAEVYVAKSRGRGQITSAITIENFSRTKKDFEKLARFLKISRFFLKNFSEGERDKQVFGLLKGFLSSLNSADKTDRAEIVAEAFWWKLFDRMGQGPEAAKCVACGKKPKSGQKNYFSVEKGGIVCSGCLPKEKNFLPISENQIKLLRLFLSNPLERITKIRISKKELERLAALTDVFRKFYFE